MHALGAKQSLACGCQADSIPSSFLCVEACFQQQEAQDMRSEKHAKQAGSTTNVNQHKYLVSAES